MRWSMARTTQALVPLFALSCADDDGVSGPQTPDVVAVSITALPATMLVGDTTQLGVAATDAAGRSLAANDVRWSSSDTSVARFVAGGRLVAVGYGAVRVQVLAGGRSASGDIAIALTTAQKRLAYAFAHNEAPVGSYQPMRAFAFNATGGGIQVARMATGRYQVTFERMARIDTAFRDVVLVTAYGSEGERCHIEDWGNAANQRDMHAHVACYLGSGAPVDSRFTVLVVGARSLPGRHGFASVSSIAPEATATAALNTWSSSGQAVAVDRSAPGSYLVHLNAPRTTFPENYFISTVGGAPDLCKVSSWNQGDWASVVCYSAAGAHTDARFTLLMLEEGRPGKRFGFAWANDPTAPIDQPYAPPATYQRSSAGIPARVTRTGIGEYSVEFPGLANGGASAEIVQVSPFGAGLTTCQLQGWTEDSGATLRAQVRCWNRASNVREDGQFTVLVLE
jgi:hypothetical protein